MLKKLSGWHSLFIVFAGVWSVMCIGAMSYNLYTYNVNVPYPTIEDTEAVFEFLKEIDKALEKRAHKAKREPELNVQEFHNRTLRNYYKERRSQISYFLVVWLVYIGFVYGMGRAIGWINREFRKEILI